MFTKTLSRPLFLITVALIGLFCWAYVIMWFTEKIQSKTSEATFVTQGKMWNVYQYQGKKHLSFDYPNTWDVQTKKDIDGTLMILFSFMQSGKSYHMIINNSHTKEYRGGGYFPVDEMRNYGNKQVLIKTIYFQNKPIEIAAVFTEFAEDDIVHTVNLDLPPRNTRFYLSIFDHVLTSFQYK
jgi:hypothetical protein